MTRRVARLILGSVGWLSIPIVLVFLAASSRASAQSPAPSVAGNPVPLEEECKAFVTDPFAVLNFGDEEVGHQSPNKTVTVTNPKTNPAVSFHSATTTGPFSVNTTGCDGDSLAPDKHCFLTATFTPTQIGKQLGTLTATYSGCPDAEHGMSTTIRLKGKGVMACNDLVITPKPVNFGKVEVLTTATQSVQLTNPAGNPTMTVSKVFTFAPFSVAKNCLNQSLAPGASCETTVSFEPGRKGEFQETLHVASEGCAHVHVALDVLKGEGVRTSVTPTPTSTSTATTTATATSTPTASATSTPTATATATRTATATKTATSTATSTRPATGTSTPTATSSPTATSTATATATVTQSPTATATQTPAMGGCGTATEIDDTGNAAFPYAVAGDGVGAMLWLNNFDTIFLSYFNGMEWSPATQVYSSSHDLFLAAAAGNPNTNQYYPLFTDDMTGTLNVLEVNSNGTTGSPVSLGSFNTGVITLDPTIDKVYVGAQSGVAPPALFVSTDNGATFTAGPMLPTLPTASILNGIAANSGVLAVLYSAGGTENAIFLPSGATAFGSPIPLFSDTNGSFSINGVAMNAAGTLVAGVLNTPSGGVTSALQSLLLAGTTSPTVTTLVSNWISQFPQPGGGIDSNNNTAFGYDDSDNGYALVLGGLKFGSTAPSTLMTPVSSQFQLTFSFGRNAFGLGGGIEGGTTPDNLWVFCFPKIAF